MLRRLLYRRAPMEGKPKPKTHSGFDGKGSLVSATQMVSTKGSKTNDYAFGGLGSELRIWVAMRLAKHVETCCSLLLGEAVDPALLDSDELAFMQSMRLVRLDVLAIDAVEDSLRKHRLKVAA